MASDRQIWPYGFSELVNLSKVILFHILVDPIRGLDAEIEKRKNNFQFFQPLPISLLFTLHSCIKALQRYRGDVNMIFFKKLKSMFRMVI